MKREQFLSRLRHYCRKNGLDVELDEKRGKGSHVTVIVNGRRTIVQYGDLTPKRMRTILRQLRLPTDALQ